MAFLSLQRRERETENTKKTDTLSMFLLELDFLAMSRISEGMNAIKNNVIDKFK